MWRRGVEQTRRELGLVRRGATERLLRMAAAQPFSLPCLLCLTNRPQRTSLPAGWLPIWASRWSRSAACAAAKHSVQSRSGSTAAVHYSLAWPACPTAVGSKVKPARQAQQNEHEPPNASLLNPSRPKTAANSSLPSPPAACARATWAGGGTRSGSPRRRWPQTPRAACTGPVAVNRGERLRQGAVAQCLPSRHSSLSQPRSSIPHCPTGSIALATTCHSTPSHSTTGHPTAGQPT